MIEHLALALVLPLLMVGLGRFAPRRLNKSPPFTGGQAPADKATLSPLRFILTTILLDLVVLLLAISTSTLNSLIYSAVLLVGVMIA